MPSLTVGPRGLRPFGGRGVYPYRVFVLLTKDRVWTGASREAFGLFKEKNDHDALQASRTGVTAGSSSHLASRVLGVH